MDLVYSLSHLVYRLMAHAADMILPLLPSAVARRLTFTKDVALSVLWIVIGRALPHLNPTPIPVDLAGRNAIVTGANSGIGLQIASDLAGMGATVYLACRNPTRAEAAVDSIRHRVPASADRVSALELDTSSSVSVKSFAETWSARSSNEDARRVDILVHNAGIATPSGGKNFNDDGIDIIYATNLLGSFLLTHLLEPYFSMTARIVFTSSTGQYSGSGITNTFALNPVKGVIEPGFHCPPAKIPPTGAPIQEKSPARYGHTKAMQCALAKLLQRKFDRDARQHATKGNDVRGRTAHAFTPGFTSTPIFGKIGNDGDPKYWGFQLLKATTAFAVDVDQGAATGTWLASTNDAQVVGIGNGGGYWDRMVRRMSTADVLSDEVLERMWIRWENDAGIQWR